MKAEVIHETAAATSILDIHPIAPGHAMVLPKVHASDILSLPNGDIDGVFRAVKETTALLKRALDPDGFTLGINHGSVSGQTVEHLHIHIVPRWRGDGGGSLHSVVDNVPDEDVATIAKKIRNSK